MTTHVYHPANVNSSVIWMEDNSSGHGTQEERVARILKLVTSEDTLLAGVLRMYLYSIVR